VRLPLYALQSNPSPGFKTYSHLTLELFGFHAADRPEDYPAFAATVAALGAPALIAWRQRQRSEDAILGMLAAHGFAVSEERSRVVDDSQVRLVRAVPLGYSRRKR
jgi:hypothetical protein